MAGPAGGGVAGAFLSALFDEGHKRADKAKAATQKQRDDEISMYRDAVKQALQQGDTARASIAMKKIDELYKLPKGKSPFSQLGEFLQKVGKKNEGQPQPGAQGASPAAGGGGKPDAGAAASPDQAKPLPSLEGGQSAAGASASPADKGGQTGGQSGAPSQPSPGPGPGKASGHLVTRAFDKAAHGLGTGLSALSNTLSPKPAGLPPLDVNAFPRGGGKETKVGQYQGEDNKMHFIFKRADNSTYEMDSEGKVTASGSKFPRVLPPISMSEAQAQAAGGQAYEGVDGQPLDLSRYNNNWQLVPIYLNGKVSYEPTSQGQTHITVGNEVYSVPKLDQAKLGTEGTPLGQSRTGTTSVAPYVGIDENDETGHVQIQRVPGQRNPETPGAQTGSPAGARTGSPPTPPAPSAPASLPSLDGKTPTVTHPTSGHPVPAARQRTASDPGKAGSAPAKSGSVARSLPIPITLWNQQQQVARPVREGATQVFGDPTQPSMKSLKDYATLADDPESRSRLAEAFNITFGHWDEEIKASGGLTHLVETAGGYPQLLAQMQAGVREDAIGKLGSDQEKDYYDSVMSSYGAIVGLRSLTKASAAAFSVTAIERELPLVGLYTFSTRQYYDQLSRLAEQVYNGTRTMVDTVMPPNEKLYYKSQVDTLGKLRDSSRDSSKGKSKSSKSSLPPLVPSDPAGIYEDVQH